MKTKLKMNLRSIFICTTENQERVRLSKEIFLIKLARTELKCNLILAHVHKKRNIMHFYYFRFMPNNL